MLGPVWAQKGPYVLVTFWCPLVWLWHCCHLHSLSHRGWVMAGHVVGEGNSASGARQGTRSVSVVQGGFTSLLIWPARRSLLCWLCTAETVIDDSREQCPW